MQLVRVISVLFAIAASACSTSSAAPNARADAPTPTPAAQAPTALPSQAQGAAEPLTFAEPTEACGAAASARGDHANQPMGCGQPGSACGDHEHAAGPPPGTVPRTEPAASASVGAADAPGALTRIEDHGGICMLSNRYLGQRPDVPIEVAGKTYHGCCANCAARLGAMAEARTAKDPITGNPVDKATAVLARDASNRVYYFESEASFAQASK